MARTATEAEDPGRVECADCHHLMVPQLVMANGAPERSYCPFCGTQHRSFVVPAKQSVATTVRDLTLGSLLGSFIGALFF